MTHFDFSKHCNCRDCRTFDAQEVRDAILGSLAVAVIVWTLWMVIS